MGQFASLNTPDKGETLTGLPYGYELNICHSSIMEPAYDFYAKPLHGETAFFAIDHDNAKRLVTILSRMIAENDSK